MKCDCRIVHNNQIEMWEWGSCDVVGLVSYPEGKETLSRREK